MYELRCTYLLFPLKLKDHFPGGRPPEEMLANFLFMDYGLIMYELCMDYAWIMHGLWHTWIMLGLCMDMNGLRLDHVWILHELCMNYA